MQVREWIEQGQSPTLVFLPGNSSARRLGEALAAMANTHGGHILLGVRGRRRAQLEGLEDAEAGLLFVLEVAAQCVPPMDLPDPEITSIDGQALLVVSVPATARQVYHWRGRYLYRAQDKSLPLSGIELRSLLLERSPNGFEALVPEGASLKDLSMGQVKAYYEQMAQDPDEQLEFLQTRGCLVETEQGLVPTHAGLLLFGRAPQDWLPQAQILLSQHDGITPEEDPLREQVGGSLAEQIQEALAFLQKHMRRGRMLVDGERVQVPEYPLPVIREALVNAVVHRDYSLTGDSIRVALFQNRIEVHSPGRLPGPITVDNLLQERFARNAVIARILAELGFGEQLGHGLRRMVSLMEEAHLPEPDLSELRASFSLTLYGPKEMALESTPTDPRALARLGLNERQVQALIYLNEQGSITSREYQELCPQVSAETLRRDFVDLLSRGMILKVGERRATYYILR
ncbi:MAG: putative DNA binding domain-containing protein [Chloroflexia bacterium]|nr:putative DNA binding domain-containing protein [Chloroflexia bacterium]